MKTVYFNKANCCGCTSCYSICPMDAIKMIEDTEGFYYPFINKSKCIECKMCKEVCPLNNKATRNNKPLKLFGVKNGNTERMKSSSGAMFTALSNYIISQNGVVFGVKFDKNYEVIHSYALSKKECERFRGSKYVQSNLGECFKDVCSFLKSNRFVLFSGTPCQCDGLKRYIMKKNVSSKKLILCDVICHGAPSPRVWNDYLSFIQKKSSIESYKFRDKRFGWHGDNISVKYKNGKERVNTPKLKIFTNLYFGNYITRKCCETCPYTSFSRISDITIGDFWGIEHANPAFDDNKGVSLVIANTAKGNLIIKKVIDKLEWFETTMNACKQEQLSHPYLPAENRSEFWHYYQKNGLVAASKKFGNYNVRGILVRYSKNFIKNIIR